MSSVTCRHSLTMQSNTAPALMVPPHFSAADPRPRGFDVSVQTTADERVSARVDTFSDRLRCDHPAVADGEALAEALKRTAHAENRGRIVVMAPTEMADDMRDADFYREGMIPGFYGGDGDCTVMGYSVDPTRETLGFANDVAEVDALVEAYQPRVRNHPPVFTERADVDDAPAIAALINATFEQYPTPSGRPDYIAEAIEDGIPFRVVRAGGGLRANGGLRADGGLRALRGLHDGEGLLACASADLITEARTAELTDCATRPAARGRGIMQAILTDLMDDLRDIDYPTAFTLARARIPGVNLAFKRLGFGFRGRMRQSCRIGGGLEDMNIWSRHL